MAEKFYLARVSLLGDNLGFIHFLIREDEGRSLEEAASAAANATFLSLRLDSLPHQGPNCAQLEEIPKEGFERMRGTLIPAGGVNGMMFYWLK